MVGAVSRELRRKLLIVDDDSELLGLLAHIVEQAGFAALPAQDPPTALETFEREQPDAVLLDVMIPWLMKVPETSQDRENTLNKVHMQPLPRHHHQAASRFGIKQVMLAALTAITVGAALTTQMRTSL